jgi:hypothetical protein
VALMKEEGVKLLREAMGIYISTLKTGIPWVVTCAWGGSLPPVKCWLRGRTVLSLANG